MNSYLNINYIIDKGTKVLGPGLRYGIWTQGCPFRCFNCTSPDTQPITRKKMIPLNEMCQSIVNNNDIEGITISGGEPFIQASKLSRLLRSVKHLRPELNVIIYTGYLYEELDWAEAIELLKEVDVVIDGGYVENLNNGIGLRGSTNQRVIFITEALAQYKDILEYGIRSSEVHINFNEQQIIGIPKN